MPCPSHPPCFDHPNNTGQRVQTMQLLIMQLSPTTRHFIEFSHHKSFKLYIHTAMFHSYRQDITKGLSMLPFMKKENSLKKDPKW
jgi:hypothetical protein